MSIEITCAQCGTKSRKAVGAVNRAAKIGAPLYCDRVCYGLARRRAVPVTKAQLVERKRLYDMEYRRKNLARITAQKATHYQATRDPERERAIRKANMPRHIEYCRRPVYRAKKAEYDAKVRAAEYGAFAEAYRLLLYLEREIRSRATSYERLKAKGYYTRNAQQRRRQLWQLMQSIRI
jgi:hypothetical protein